MKKVTIDQIESWNPCPEWTRKRMLEASGGREELTPLEIARLETVSAENKLWVLLRLRIIDERHLHWLATDFAVMVLPVFEREYPDDKRPRLAIEAKRAWLRGEIDTAQLDGASVAAVYGSLDAARDANPAASHAASAAAAAASDEVINGVVANASVDAAVRDVALDARIARATAREKQLDRVIQYLEALETH